jgi:hypothetical protein
MPQRKQSSLATNTVLAVWHTTLVSTFIH